MFGIDKIACCSIAKKVCGSAPFKLELPVRADLAGQPARLGAGHAVQASCSKSSAIIVAAGESFPEIGGWLPTYAKDTKLYDACGGPTRDPLTLASTVQNSLAVVNSRCDISLRPNLEDLVHGKLSMMFGMAVCHL